MRHAIPSGRGDATNRLGRSPQRERCLRQRRGFCPSLVIESPHQAALSILHAFWRGADSIQPDCMSPVRQQSSTGLARTKDRTGELFQQASALRPMGGYTERQHAEFLYACVRQTIERNLPNETHFLRSFSTRFRVSIECSTCRSGRRIKGSFRNGRERQRIRLTFVGRRFEDRAILCELFRPKREP
jgi:hypothetical protein